MGVIEDPNAMRERSKKEGVGWGHQQGERRKKMKSQRDVYVIVQISGHMASLI